MKKQIILNIPYNKSLNIETSLKNPMVFTKILKRYFSSTIMKQAKPGVTLEVEKLIEKSKVFDKNLKELKDMTETHSLLEAKAKLDALKDQEWSKQSAFMEKYIPYLNAKDRKKIIDKLDQGERMDDLINKKLEKLNLSRDSSLLEFKESIKLSDLTYSNKYKIFSQIEDLFKSTFDNSNMSRAEKDGFNILLAKRHEEKKIFLDFKNKHVNTLKEKIDSALNSSTNLKSPNVKPSSPVTESPFYQGVSDTKGSIAESSSSFLGKPPVSEEILTVIEELLDYFS